jgi:hypothetical protein
MSITIMEMHATKIPERINFLIILNHTRDRLTTLNLVAIITWSEDQLDFQLFGRFLTIFSIYLSAPAFVPRNIIPAESANISKLELNPASDTT